MHHDVIVVGGGFAGLAAATYLGRARRSVLVLDTGRPRNRFAAASHGFLGHDGSAPADILAAARRQLAAYPTVRVVDAEAMSAREGATGFDVPLAGGDTASATKLILAFGLRDILPDVPGLAERWGRSVLHCPYCHGIEFADRPLGVLYAAAKSVHQAQLIAEWGPTTLYLNGAGPLDGDAMQMLAVRGVSVEPRRIDTLAGGGDALRAVVLAGGDERPIAALYVAPESVLSSPLAAELGCAIEDGPLGQTIRTDPLKATTVDGVFAAGDIARAPHSVSWAVADGVTAGTAMHRSLVFG